MRGLILCVLILLITNFIRASVYYVNSDEGEDTNSGRTPAEAWASLEKVNAMVFQPGDTILFKAGTSYQGQLEPKGSGSKLKPIIIDKYDTGKRPAIHGQGLKQYTLLLQNIEYWEVSNLEITNRGEERTPGRRGVSILAENFGDCRHIVLDSLEIHEVNGSLVKSEGGGSAIWWKNSGDQVKTRFVGLVIQNCHIHHCERNGINSNGYTRRDNWHPSQGVVIRNNLLEQVPGDGIVPIGCEGVLIEHNVMRDCPDILSHQEAAAGIWPWSSDNTLIQFNEVSGHKAKWDGQGFDSDFNCRGTIIQYNYSHDNYGGFLLICNKGDTFGTPGNIGTKNSIIRYNVSINDGIRPYPTQQKGWFSPVMHITGPVQGTKIYNNVIIIPEKENAEMDQAIVDMDNWGDAWPQDTWFANNVFFVQGQSAFRPREDEGTVFTHNCYFGEIDVVPDDSNAVFSDPEFANVSARGDGFDILRAFMITKKSPLNNSGIPIREKGLSDLFGNPVPDIFCNIGVHQFLRE